MSQFSLIVVAGGSGSRMNNATKKAFIEIHDEPLLIHTLRAFSHRDDIVERIVVLPEAELLELSGEDSHMKMSDYDGPNELLLTMKKLGVLHLVVGGDRRQDSVLNGLWATSEQAKFVMVHDAARPFVDANTLDQLMQRTMKCGAAILAHPVRDTLKQADDDQITGTVSRENLWGAQTPQAFNRALLRKAFSEHNGKDVTDDASLVALTGTSVEIVDGGAGNFKITTPFDLKLAEALIANK
ncbi:2-C-methyl-D-erythritol 4-phosphate cytidylyltransferase [Planctomycetota bacterium]|nr:2-C-methyl-D-erythritol 4-phosphate cytidylyltransferase [Planctomycetota bacterium]